MSNKNKIQPDWWLKSLTGLILGFAFALAMSGIFAWEGPDGIAVPNKVQFNMWILAPIWMLMLSFVYLFKTGVRALLWYGSVCIAAYAVLYMVRG